MTPATRLPVGCAFGAPIARFAGCGPTAPGVICDASLRQTSPVADTPYRFLDAPRRDVLVLCDHAGNAIPEELGDLGLPEAERQRHIAWDPGAAGVAEELARRLGCPAILGIYSRLVVDLNRGHDDATLILAESDNTFVPANITIHDDQRADRVARWHAPYHSRIDAHLDGCIAHGIRPTVIAVHSFNPQLNGVDRPWPVGVLWKLSRDPVAGLIDALSARHANVGDNVPYDGRTAMGWTLEHHAVRRGLPHVMFELRNDVVSTPETQLAWGRTLHEALIESRFIAP
jgi:predicted N-formylglutamate amidohydrolase